MTEFNPPEDLVPGARGSAGSADIHDHETGAASSEGKAAAISLVPVDPLFQVRLIVVGNGVILLSVWLAIEYGKFANRTLPGSFWIPELAIVLVGALVAFTEFGPRVAAWSGRTDYKDSPSMLHWMSVREPALGPLVYVFTAVAVFALAQLVQHTGGVIGSPFLPFLTTPALFGPFVAKDKRTVGLIIMLVVGIVVFLTTKGHTTTINRCAGSNCKAGSASAETHSAFNMPSKWVYSGVTIVVLLVAGGISTSRLAREQELETWIRDRIAESPSSGNDNADYTSDPKDKRDTEDGASAPDAGAGQGPSREEEVATSGLIGDTNETDPDALKQTEDRNEGPDA
jgi:hypothetical protein